MITSRYKDAYKEVYTILSYLEDEEYNKIPSNVINAIKNNMNVEYKYEMNEEVDLFSQPMLPETRATLFNLFRDYLAIPEQTEKILKMQAEEKRKLELKKQEKYNKNELFNNKKKTESSVQENVTMVKYKENIFVKIKKIIRRLLNKRKN